MERHTRRKMMILLALLGLLGALVPVPASAEGAGIWMSAMIANAGFEQVEQGKPTGWTAWGTASVYETVYEPVRSGSYSVKLTDSSAQTGTGLRSSQVAVEPGLHYRASVYGYNESGVSQLYLEFWNSASERIEVKIAAVPSQHQWQKTELTAIAPPNAAYATLLLYQHNANVGVAYFDDAVFEEHTPEFPPNAGFEESAAGKPVGWTPLAAGTDYATVTSVVYSGSFSVRMVDPTDASGPGLRSGHMPVTPQQMYEASAYSYNESGSSQLYLEFWNSANTRIGTKIVSNNSTGKWSRMTVEGEAPPEAATATLLLYQHKGNVGTAYFDEAAFRLVPPEPIRQFPIVQTSHPRLYFTAAEVPALQARAADTVHAPFGKTGKQLWDTVKMSADAFLTETSFSRTYYGGKVVTFPLPPVQPEPIENPPGFTSRYPYWTMMTRSIQERLETLSLAYTVTGDAAYADKAKQYVLSLAAWDSWTDPTYACGGETCLDTAHLTLGVSAALDMLYDRFTVSERADVLAALETKGLAPLYADVRAKLDHNIQSLRAAALGSGAAVLLGHSPNAHAYLTRSMNYYLWYLDERMTSGNQEGLLYTSYAMDNMIKTFDHIDRVTGINELSGHPFLDDFLVRWIVYALAPGGAGLANFSDSGAVNYFGLTMSVMNAWLDNGQAGWYVQETGATGAGIDGFLYFRPDAAVTAPDGQWQPSAVLDEIGWAMLRSGWGQDDVLFAMISNQSSLGHNHFDQNSFQIAVNGSWIAGDPGYQDYVAGPANDLTLRLGHSTIQVDGQGQTARGNGSLTAGLLAPSYDYVKGSAAGAYGNTLSKYDRNVVYLKPDTFVMLDDLQASAPHVYDWVLFSGALNEFAVDGQIPQEGQTVNGSGLYLRAGGAQLAAKFLSSAPLPITVGKHPGAESYGYYTRVGSGSAASDYRFLTVMQARPYSPEHFYDHTKLLPLADSSGQEVKTIFFNGETSIFYRGAQSGDYMTVTVEVPETGNYELRSRFLKSPLYGTVQAYVDGQPVGGVYDGYAAQVEGPVSFMHGTVALAAGTHTVRYEVTGKNSQSGNFFIGLNGLSVLPEGAEDTGMLEVEAELVPGTNGVGAAVERNDGSGARDLAIFRTGAAPFAVGGAAGDAEQAVVGMAANDAIVGYSVTRGSTLASGGQTLLSGSAPFSASMDKDSVTGEVYGVVELPSAQTVELYAGFSALSVEVDGQTLAPGAYTIHAATGTVSIDLSAGRREVRLIPD